MSSILITGGAGFIGSRLALNLCAGGDRVVVFDNFHPQVHVSAGEVTRKLSAAGAEVITADVRDAKALRAALFDYGVQIVVHLAAETGTGQSYDLPRHYCDVNITGTATLIEAVRYASSVGHNVNRILLAGSRAVYGEGACRNADGRIVTAVPRLGVDLAAGDFSPKDAAGSRLVPVASKADNTVVAPASIYASTKLMQEYILRQGLAQSGIAGTVLRLQNVYGVGQSLHNPYTGVLSIFAQQLIKGETLNIFEDGRIVRDFVNVADVVAAFEYLCRAPCVPDKVIDIGSGRRETILGVAEMMVNTLGLPNDRLQVSGRFRPGDIRHALADIADAKALLNWEPKIAFEEGVLELLNWARETLSNSSTHMATPGLLIPLAPVQPSKTLT